MVFFAGITKQHDLLHKVSIRKITSAKLEKAQVVLDFKDEKGRQHQVVLRTRDEKAFLESIGY
jgi:hypothetical protein